jgi:hypothetical protein
LELNTYSFSHFILYAEREACEKVMHGRFFGGRRVVANEYSLNKFQAQEYDA